MTPSEKAVETRRARAEAKAQRFRDSIREREEVKAALLRVVNDENAPADVVVRAVELLTNMR